jgi:TDG/mug DNA glycosylase family protein
MPRRLPDVLAPDLDVVFCGINPSLYSAAAGHHFARPGNRFWPVLYRAGFTPRLWSPAEDRRLLALGYGLTNIVARATTRADELRPGELVRGARILRQKLALYRPRFLAVVGIGAYRVAFDRPKAGCGDTDERIGGTQVWVLPNTSGLNASFQMPELTRQFRKLRLTSSAARPRR